MSEICAWCGDAIDTDDHYVLKRVSASGSTETVEHFHGDELPCMTEARDYGWGGR